MSFMDFIEICTYESEKAPPPHTSDSAAQLALMLHQGRTPEELVAFFQSLGVEVTKGDCIRLIRASEKSKGPTPNQFNSKY